MIGLGGQVFRGGGGAVPPPDVFDLLQNSETNLQNYCAFKGAGTPEVITPPPPPPSPVKFSSSPNAKLKLCPCHC